MNTVHRQFGKLKSKGDTTKVSVLLNDYEDANKALKQVSTFYASLAVFANVNPDC